MGNSSSSSPSCSKLFMRQILFEAYDNNNDNATTESNFFTATRTRRGLLQQAENFKSIGLNFREPDNEIPAITKHHGDHNMDIITALLWWMFQSKYEKASAEQQLEACNFLKEFLKSQATNKNNVLTKDPSDESVSFIDVISPLSHTVGFIRSPDSSSYKSPIDWIVPEHPKMHGLLEVLLDHVPSAYLHEKCAPQLVHLMSAPVYTHSILLEKYFDLPPEKFIEKIDAVFPHYRKSYLVLLHFCPITSTYIDLMDRYCSSDIFRRWGVTSRCFECLNKKMEYAIELWRDILSSGRVTDKLIFKRRYNETCVERAVKQSHYEIVRELISHILSSSRVDLEAELSGEQNNEKHNLLQLAFCKKSLADRESIVFSNLRKDMKDHRTDDFFDRNICEIVSAVLTLPGATKWKVAFNAQQTGQDIPYEILQRIPKTVELMSANGLELSL